jgi:hypothetical protein
MRVDSGITNVPSAGTAVQIANVTNRVKYVEFKALIGNTGVAYVGESDVSASNGFELSAGNTKILNFGEFGGSVPANIFYVDAATNGDKVSWSMILEG